MTASETDLSIRTEPGAGGTTVSVVGEIDSSNCEQLQAVLTDQANTGQVDVDLSEVSFIDSSGLRALLLGHRVIGEAGGRMRITAASENVRRLFEITGLTERLL